MVRASCCVCSLRANGVSFLIHYPRERGCVQGKGAPEIPVRFYRTSGGREPVLEWLRNPDKQDRRVIGLDLMRVQLGWPIGMPLVRSLKNGLWEERSALPNYRTARLMLCFHEMSWWYCTASSRRPGRHRLRTLRWRDDG